MSQHKATEYVSLAYALDCILSGREFETDAAKPETRFEFPDRHEAFESIVRAVLDGDVRPLGHLGVVELDLPTIEVDIPGGSVAEHCKYWRKSKDILVASGVEPQLLRIPPDAWWHDGVVWEYSALWAKNPFALEARTAALSVEQHTPFPPERPYSFERAVCFLEIKLRLQEIRDLSIAKRMRTIAPRSPNPRNAGMKPTENYELIEVRLRELIEQDKHWLTWQYVWDDVRHLFKHPEEIEKGYPDQPYKKLSAHLKNKAPMLYDELRRRIRSSQQRRS